MPTRILYVTGKGGTGKSFVSSLLAQAGRARGLAAAVVRVHATPGNGASQDASGEAAPGRRETASQARAVLEIEIDESAALRDFVAGIVRLGFVADRLLASRTFSAVAAAAPGVKDLVTLAAIADIAARRGRRSLDLLVVDAPASGHSVPLVTASAKVIELMPFGPAATAARRVELLVKNPHRFRAVVVSTPEELALSEAVTLHRDLLVAGAATTPILVNRLQALLANPAQSDWLEKTRVSGDALFHLAVARRQGELLAELERRCGPCLKLRDLSNANPFDPARREIGGRTHSSDVVADPSSEAGREMYKRGERVTPLRNEETVGGGLQYAAPAREVPGKSGPAVFACDPEVQALLDSLFGERL